MSHLLLTAQSHARVSSEPRDSLSNLRSSIGTRRGSTSFLDILQRRAHWHTHSKPLPHPVCSCPKPEQSHREAVNQLHCTRAFKESHKSAPISGNVSSTEPELFPNGCDRHTNSVNPNPQIYANSAMHRHSLVPCCCPHYCQAGLTVLLTAGGNRVSLEHSPSSCHSPVDPNQALISGLPPLCLVHPTQSTSAAPIHQTAASPINMTSSPSIHPTIQSSLHAGAPHPTHTTHSCSGQVPVKSPRPKSNMSVDMSVSLSATSPASTHNTSSLSSTDLRLPLSPISLGLPLFPAAAQSCTSTDRDLSHLNHCLHHIINRRTSSPVLMDRTVRQPGNSHGNVTVYNLPVNDIQSLGATPIVQPQAPDAPPGVLGSKVGQDVTVRRKMATPPLIPKKTCLLYGADTFTTSTL